MDPSWEYAEVSSQLNAPVALLAGKWSPFPIGYEAGWAPCPVLVLWKRETSNFSGGNQISLLCCSKFSVDLGSQLELCISEGFKLPAAVGAGFWTVT
jgi:hypothetical protein